MRERRKVQARRGRLCGGQVTHRWLKREGELPGLAARSLRVCAKCGLIDARGHRPRGGEGQWGGKTGWVKLWFMNGQELRWRPECTGGK